MGVTRLTSSAPVNAKAGPKIDHPHRNLAHGWAFQRQKYVREVWRLDYQTSARNEMTTVFSDSR